MTPLNSFLEAEKKEFTERYESFDFCNEVSAPTLVRLNNWLSSHDTRLLEKILEKIKQYEYDKDEVHCTCLAALKAFLLNTD